jgi:hypothetical protein
MSEKSAAPTQLLHQYYKGIAQTSELKPSHRIEMDRQEVLDVGSASYVRLQKQATLQTGLLQTAMLRSQVIINPRLATCCRISAKERSIPNRL